MWKTTLTARLSSSESACLLVHSDEHALSVVQGVLTFNCAAGYRRASNSNSGLQRSCSMPMFVSKSSQPLQSLYGAEAEGVEELSD